MDFTPSLLCLLTLLSRLFAVYQETVHMSNAHGLAMHVL